MSTEGVEIESANTRGLKNRHVSGAILRWMVMGPGRQVTVLFLIVRGRLSVCERGRHCIALSIATTMNLPKRFLYCLLGLLD